MTPIKLLLQRCLTVLSAALLAGLLAAVGTWIPVGATGTHGATGANGEGGDRDDPDALQIVLIRDRGSGLLWPVEDRKFDVVVQVVDDDLKPTEVHEPTKIKLTEVSGPGELGGNTTAIIQKDFSSTVILGATYSQFANGVVLKVEVIYGEHLDSDEITVEVALTAVGADAKPGKPLKLKDPDCVAPTSKVPNCGILLLKNGADGHVTLSVGSCDDLADKFGGCRERANTEALVVTAIASLRDSDGDPLYSKKHPAKLILVCDKVLCGKSDHKWHGKTGHKKPKIRVLYTLNNTGPLTDVAPACPKKGVIGKDQEVCVDYKNSKQHKGDLYLPLLYTGDLRMSG